MTQSHWYQWSIALQVNTFTIKYMKYINSIELRFESLVSKDHVKKYNHVIELIDFKMNNKKWKNELNLITQSSNLITFKWDSSGWELGVT